MPSSARGALADNKADIDRLWQIHEEVAGGGAGRKRDVEVLNRAAIVLITACWESYVEDVALEAFDYLVANAPAADKIPSKVRALASADLIASKNATAVWDLADGGWRQVLQAHRTAVKQRWVDSLNTPKTEQVDTLFEDLLGLRSLHSAWHWQGMAAKKAGAKLDSYIVVRGQIAHRVTHNSAVYKNWISDYVSHVESLADTTDGAVAAHVSIQVGSAPW